MATYTAPTTRSSGFLVTAAVYNTDLVENIKYFKDAPTFDGAVTASSTLTVANNVGLAAAKKLYLDGVALTGDTYLSESSANVLSLFSGGVEAKLTSGVLTVSGLGTHTFSAGGTGGNAIALRNTAGGTGDYTYLVLGNDSYTNALEFFALSSTYTTSGIYVQGSAVMRTRSEAGLSIAADNASGTIRFYSGGSTERIRLDASGYLMVNTTTANARLTVVDDTNVQLPMAVRTTQSSGGTLVRWLSGTTIVGSVTTTSSATSYNTSSDARLKRDRGPATDLIALRGTIIRDFDWLRTDKRGRGVFAQEAILLKPEAVTPGTDQLDANGFPVVPWGVDYSKYVPDLIVGWQQHDATINQLAARIAALESK